MTTSDKKKYLWGFADKKGVSQKKKRARNYKRAKKKTTQKANA